MLTMPLRLLDPIAWLRDLNDFLDGFLQAWDMLHRKDDKMIVTTIHCPCGNEWEQRKPEHYAGKGGVPMRCDACDGAGEILPQNPLGSSVAR